MKIVIIGYSGAGKSAMARQLGEKYDCPVLHLDKVNFLPQWQERDLYEAREIVKIFLENESWIIDGNYSEFYFIGGSIYGGKYEGI